MTDIKDLSVSEAASKALELIVFSYYEKYYNSISFEDYLANTYPDIENGDFDLDEIWREFHYEAGNEGTRDGLTGKVVKSHGGEGQGDEYWMVISLSDGNTTRYFRKDGWYASYDGGYLDGETYEVKPAERLVTYYE